MSKRDKKKIRLFFLIHRAMVPIQSNQLEIRWSENSISFEREDGLASYLLFRRWLGLRATYASNASTAAREFFVSLSAMRGESARSDVSREKNSESNGGESPTLLLVSNGRERRTRRRSASRNARFSLRRRAPYLFSSFGGISSSVGIVGLRCFYHSRGGETRTQLE